MISRTIKRLLSASRLSICFDHAGPPRFRYIHFHKDEVTDNTSMYQMMEREGIPFEEITSIRGGIIDVLDYIDFLLEKMDQPTLEEDFDKFNNWKFDWFDREDWEEQYHELIAFRKIVKNKKDATSN